MSELERESESEANHSRDQQGKMARGIEVRFLAIGPVAAGLTSGWKEMKMLRWMILRMRRELKI